jgi:hypothetical protein
MASGICPECGPVYLGCCERVWPTGVAPQFYVCEHQGPDGRHRWETLGPIDVRPVVSLHVDVV